MAVTTRKIRFALVAAVVGVAVGVAAPSAYAADTVDVSDGKVHVVGDLTGDGAADTIKVQATRPSSGGWYESLKIYVNDTLVKSDSGFSSVPSMYSAEVLTTNSEKSVLYLISGYGSRERPYHGLYTFIGGKEMQTSVNFATLYPVGSGIGSSLSLKGEEITAKVTQNGFGGCDPASGHFKYTVKFKWDGNELKRASDTCKVTPYGWTSTQYRTYKLYKAPGGKKVVTTVKKGVKAKGIQIRFIGDKCYMQVKTKTGKTGWYMGHN